MDLVKIGKFIAELRKEQGLTQEQLGEKLGVSNKTVSRWETGTYLPPAEALLEMSSLFSLSVNEILTGKRLDNEEYRKAAEANLTAAIRESRFSLNDRIAFFRKKWLKEHIAVLIFAGVCILAVFLVGIVQKNLWVIYLSLLLTLAAHGWRNNTMMAYVERNAYDGSGRQ